MKLISASVRIFAVLLFSALLPPIAFSAPNPLESKITAIETSIRRVKAAQQKIIDQNAQIKEELQALKIWIRHHP